MKFLSTLFFLSLTVIGLAQSDNFEGKVTFSYSYEGADIEAYKPYLQTQSVYYFKGKDVRFEMVGGMSSMLGYTLMDGDERIAYNVNDLQKKAFIMDRDTSDNQSIESDPNIDITATGETESILNYSCKKYKIYDKEEETTIFVWLTTDISFTNPEEYGGAAAGIFFPGVDGVMLKMQAETDMGNGQMLKVTQTVSEITQAVQDASLFEIPADYEIKEFDPAEMFGAGSQGY